MKNIDEDELDKNLAEDEDNPDDHVWADTSVYPVIE